LDSYAIVNRYSKLTEGDDVLIDSYVISGNGLTTQKILIIAYYFAHTLPKIKTHKLTMLNTYSQYPTTGKGVKSVIFG
jgi:hypothetical protein